MINAAALVAVFVLADIAVASHVELEQHASDAPCAICLTISVFGGANVAHAELVLSAGIAERAPAQLPALVSSRHRGPSQARAPPVVS